MEQLTKLLKMLKWDSILTSLLAIFIGVVFVILPEDSAMLLCTVCGVSFIVCGAVALIYYFARGFLFGHLSMLFGIMLILCGVFFITNPAAVSNIFNLIFGLYIVISGCILLSDAIDCARAGFPGFGWMLASALITVLLGCIVLFGRFDAVMLFAGYALIYDGISNLVLTLIFSHRIRQARQSLRARTVSADFTEKED